MQASLRKILIDSHVAAVTIAVLLFSSLYTAFLALWGPVNGILYFLASGAPGMPPFAYLNLDEATHYMLPEVLTNLPAELSLLFEALVSILAAWLLSRWTYGVGPLRALACYRDKLSRKTHA
jgi:hypothetical protein